MTIRVTAEADTTARAPVVADFREIRMVLCSIFAGCSGQTVVPANDIAERG
jgi:hypothetical protein